ncbi:DUF6177 family protein, partial [Streptomyces flavofungini]|uniref:DUF6177 family protein n=1 Tax=Streptomyces flavofungini TaxID=68200 RepID=UPI0034DF1B90
LAAEHGLTSMLTTLRAARRDLTVPPHFQAPPIPVSFTLGPDAAHPARHPEGTPQPIRLGPAARQALHYTLGDGTDANAWSSLERIIGQTDRSPEAADPRP